jgi:hypothetical protein
MLDRFKVISGGGITPMVDQSSFNELFKPN